MRDSVCPRFHSVHGTEVFVYGDRREAAVSWPGVVFSSHRLPQGDGLTVKVLQASPSHCRVSVTGVSLTLQGKCYRRLPHTAG